MTTNAKSTWPAWVVLHVPHDATEIPASVRDQYVLDEHALERELVRMTDHHTLTLFGGEQCKKVVRAPVSRLVVDVERFEDDAIEPMAAVGMGVVYAITSDLRPLRHDITPQAREALLNAYYRPHHERFEQTVSDTLAEHGQCLIIDCHSFPNVALPYEGRQLEEARPDICIGTDDFHTNAALAACFVQAFESEGWRVSLNTPFAGAIVPASRYRRDRRVAAIMVEVNRSLYMGEGTAVRSPGFADIASKIQACCHRAMTALGAQGSGVP